MNSRKNVSVAGLTGKWTTNLSDDDVREFYERHAARAEADELRFKIAGAEIGVRFGAVAARFKGGMCLWHAVGDKNTMILRNMKDWALLKARQREIQELREEQEIPGLSAEELAWLEGHLIERLGDHA